MLRIDVVLACKAAVAAGVAVDNGVVVGDVTSEAVVSVLQGRRALRLHWDPSEPALVRRVKDERSNQRSHRARVPERFLHEAPVRATC